MSLSRSLEKLEFAKAAFNCSKLTMETLDQCMKYVQSWQ